MLRYAIRDGHMSSTRDLSQSAYDSAMAGVEDSKVFLNKKYKSCSGSSYNPEICKRLSSAIRESQNSCNALYAGGYGIGSASEETKIKSSQESGKDDLNQAYTCLKLNDLSSNYLSRIQKNTKKIIPLNGEDGFKSIKISWHNKENYNSNTSNKDILKFNKRLDIPKSSEWANSPSILKVQIFGYNINSDRLDDINGSIRDDGIGIDERIYRPYFSTSETNNSDELPQSKRTGKENNSTTKVTPVSCNISSLFEYACQVNLNILDKKIENANIRLYAIITPIYSDTSLKLELIDNNKIINFKDVQYVVDSTGRANDHFRRVESRLEMKGFEFPLPNYTITIDGDNAEKLCKNFWVTKKRQGFNECR